VPKPLPPTLAEAVAFAVEAHGSQRRKDGSPYVSHLLQVCGLVLEHDGSHDAAVAALLHDVVEDTPVTFSEVGARFGTVVESIVRECTDSIEGEGRGPDTWERRKALYLSHLETASADAALVSACDKLHNLRAMVRGDVSSSAFHASAERQRWFYESLVSIFDGRGDVPAPIVDELRSLTALAWR
jgi:(p)ppGpp synthase/HD superfamily hydrolase